MSLSNLRKMHIGLSQRRNKWTLRQSNIEVIIAFSYLIIIPIKYHGAFLGDQEYNKKLALQLRVLL